MFLLEPEQAFGPHNPDLVQRLARADLPAGDIGVHEHGRVRRSRMAAEFTGLVRELDAESALLDFNHPLAGKAVRFEVEVVGVL